ncbi:MAG: hypothetical protein JW804_08365 [Sedimentisphaerales bacterium]|nr:hypothetical protein [Sedimentisphaerales bacterium]
MIKAAGRILKSNDVKLEGRFHLDAANAGSNLPGQRAAALTKPQVRVVENNPKFAVIEITCCCGTKMSLKCEYAGAAEPGPDDPQT